MGGVRKIGNVLVIRLSDIDSNIYIIGDTVIDSGTGFNFTRLYQVFKMLKIDLKDIRHIVNTHGHFDHIGGNGYFINADISIHESDADVVEKGDNKKSYADFFDGKLKPREVDRRLKEGDSLKADDMEFSVIHTPGHTPGSICLYDSKSKTLITGDTVFSDGVGRTDMPGGNEEDLNASIEKISGLEVKRLLPGHGNVLVCDSPRKVADIMSAPPESGEEEES